MHAKCQGKKTALYVSPRLLYKNDMYRTTQGCRVKKQSEVQLQNICHAVYISCKRLENYILNLEHWNCVGAVVHLENPVNIWEKILDDGGVFV